MAGTVAWKGLPRTASTSTVVAVAPSAPELSRPKASSSERAMRTLKPCLRANTESPFGSSPPLAATRPA